MERLNRSGLKQIVVIDKIIRKTAIVGAVDGFVAFQIDILLTISNEENTRKTLPKVKKL